MLRTNTTLLFCAFLVLASLTNLSSQSNVNQSKLKDLPFEFSWSDKSIQLRTKLLDPTSNKFFNVAPSPTLEKIGNDIVQVNSSGNTNPVIMDMSKLYVKKDYQVNRSGYIDDSIAQIDIEVPKIGVSRFDEEDSFFLKITNYSKSEKWSNQTFVFKGLDVFFIVADDGADVKIEGKTITVDVSKSKTDYLLLKGGGLNMEEAYGKIPDLCRKYNNRYFVNEEAFVCIEDCSYDDPNAEIHLKHIRNLITQYNITDFDDAPISYIGDILLTKKGVGMNLNKIEYTKGLFSKKSKKSTINNLDTYRFFPWHEFIHLNFEKYIGKHHLIVNYPYSADFVYDSRLAFTNVELIQFFNELKMVITQNLY